MVEEFYWSLEGVMRGVLERAVEAVMRVGWGLM